VKNYVLAPIICLLGFLFACEGRDSSSQDSPWAQSIGTLTVEELEDGSYGYTITYSIPESTAVTTEGSKIQDPIQQHGMSQRKPIDKQKLKLKYMKEEPIIFELIDPIQYEK